MCVVAAAAATVVGRSSSSFVELRGVCVVLATTKAVGSVREQGQEDKCIANRHTEAYRDRTRGNMQGELDLTSRSRGSSGAECLEVWRLELERREVFLGVPSNDGSVRCRHLHAVGPPILGEVGGNRKVEVFILSRDGA